jgi:hypothetical protein
MRGPGGRAALVALGTGALLAAGCSAPPPASSEGGRPASPPHAAPRPARPGLSGEEPGSAAGWTPGAFARLGPGRQARARLARCAVTAKLIPTCGAWFGIAPEIFTGRPPARATARAEHRMGRRAAIVHVYHRGGQLFPTRQERALARHHILLINWKPSIRVPWAAVAAGALDRRIDRLAAHIRRTFHKKFFLTIHHEPENDVVERRGSGRTAADYAAMYRRVVRRLRSHGVTNAVTVMTYMGAPNWATKPWFKGLYPGDGVVDWLGIDPYADRRVRDFAGLVDKTRADHPSWPGFYRWIQAHYPAKPIMLAEWGVFERPGDPGYKARVFASASRQIRHYPQIKALVYFDSPRAPRGDTSFDATPAARRAFTALAHNPYFRATPVP